MGFIECDSCRAKPGTPALCKGCLHNRSYIYSLEGRDGPMVDIATVSAVRQLCEEICNNYFVFVFQRTPGQPHVRVIKFFTRNRTHCPPIEVAFDVTEDIAIVEKRIRMDVRKYKRFIDEVWDNYDDPT